jgi:hypothetical protein
MYGCTFGDAEAPFLMHAVIAADGTWHEDWVAWLRRSNLSSVFHIGHTEMWPSVADDARIRRLLPLLCSINPMGTPCRRFQREAAAPLLSRIGNHPEQQHDQGTALPWPVSCGRGNHASPHPATPG